MTTFREWASEEEKDYVANTLLKVVEQIQWEYRNGKCRSTPIIHDPA